MEENANYFVLQASLNKLMETLGQAEPYFVKCIRSNAEKVKMSCKWVFLAQFTSNWVLNFKS